jgi:hypothetical protein
MNITSKNVFPNRWCVRTRIVRNDFLTEVNIKANIFGM